MSTSVVSRLAALEKRMLEAEVAYTENREAIRAILTVLHPNPDHDEVTDPALVPFHDLVMRWIEKYGREGQ